MAAPRPPLCTYFSRDPACLTSEIQAAYRAAAPLLQPAADAAAAAAPAPPELLALLVPHGAACDGFIVAAHGYAALCASLRARRCVHLTAVLLGTEHAGTTPVALSRRDWLTPLGIARADVHALDWLVQHHALPVLEAPHASEHSIENQLPFLQHAAAWGWDLAAAQCLPEASLVQEGQQQQAQQQQAQQQQAQQQEQPMPPASLSIVPISIGYLGHQPSLVRRCGAAVAGLLAHLRARCQQAGGGNSAVVLIVTSDFTHAGPGYCQQPPRGVSLQDYMARQDGPLLQAVLAASVQQLLAAAAATHSRACGVWPLAVALAALYGPSDGAGAPAALALPPVLLRYAPAHVLWPRLDSTDPEGRPWSSSWQQRLFNTGNPLVQAAMFLLDRLSSALLPRWMVTSHSRNMP